MTAFSIQKPNRKIFKYAWKTPKNKEAGNLANEDEDKDEESDEEDDW